MPNYIGFDGEDEDAWYDYGEAWIPWLSAVTGHHGVLPEEVESPNVADIPKEIRAMDRVARREWVRSLEAWFLHPAGLSLQDQPPALSPLLAGFCAVCDWLGSNSDPRYFPYHNQQEEELLYWERRQENAARVLQDSGICRIPLTRGACLLFFQLLSPIKSRLSWSPCRPKPG
ncbi:HD domain-containing protein [Nitrosococcus watsonii]|uniref:HD domain-containing protein n=1 Tax=Nitrosococcus watsonii TaxID=473531 RepID=UPI0012F7796D|nr:HD domain-containing protein [Nitrosococcus watsonii]